jgi:serine/threonine protein kinase
MDFFAKVKSFFRNDRLDVSSRYELMKESISGTMSKFRVAREIKTGKLVGMKFLDGEKTAAFEARFKGLSKPSEGEIAVHIKHPRVVETYEFGVTTNNRQYIVMEYVEGIGLNALINNRDPILEGKRVLLIRQMAEALDAVHKAGYIHRDICPRNYICSPDATSLKLIDFGLTLPNQKEYRQPGNRTGTPLYMAPEIVRRRPTDVRVDIFALGVTSYKVCTYEPPWPGSDTTGLAALTHDTQPPTDILEYRPQLNKTLAKAIMQCLAVNPDNRPESAEHFLRLIRGVESDDET